MHYNFVLPQFYFKFKFLELLLAFDERVQTRQLRRCAKSPGCTEPNKVFSKSLTKCTT